MFKFKKKFTMFYALLCLSIIILEIVTFEVFAQTVATLDTVDTGEVFDEEKPMICPHFPRCKARVKSKL